MIADRRSASARLETQQQPDRCPFARPFSADFAGCPTFHPLGFVGVDSLNRPLPASLTCRHLTVGANTHPGRFYPRCDLGAHAERQRWLAGVGPERVALTGALQRALDAATQADREVLHAAKTALLAAPNDPAAGQRFERALRLYLAAVRSFVLSNQARLDDVGLGEKTMLDVVADWARAWADSRDGAAHLLRDLGNLIAPSQALPAPVPVDEEARDLVGRRAARLPMRRD